MKSVKEILIRSIGFLAGFLIAANVINGFKLTLLPSVFVMVFILALLQFFLPIILSFLTIPTKTSVIFVINVLLISILFYFFNIFVPGIHISDGQIGPIVNDWINIPTVYMKSYTIIFVVSIFLSAINALISWILSNNKSQ